MAEQTMRDFGLDGGELTDKTPIDNYYLLVIAVDHYENEIPTLSNPVRDANRIARALTSKYKFLEPAAADLRDTDGRYSNKDVFQEPIMLYQDVKTYCLYNEKATLENITDQLKIINNEIGKNDALLIYCAGHGEVAANNNYYFIPQDGKKGKTTSWLRIDEFYNYYNNFNDQKKCKDLLVILDCCFAGKIAQGFGKKNGESFSRYVLTSCLAKQKAADGIKDIGSSFARALEFVLTTNSLPFSIINKDILNKKFLQYCTSLFHKEDRVQEILYSQLPMETGEGEFPFELKEKNVPPIDLLTRVFIEHLNFSHQKTDFIEHYHEGGQDDFIIISTISKTFNIHKLQAKVLFEEIKTQSKLKLLFTSPIELHPDKLSLTVWDTLKKELRIEETSNVKNLIARNICGRLLVDMTRFKADDPIHNETLIIYWGCKFQSAEQTKEIMDFCKEFLELISTTKKLQEFQNKTFKKLLLLIADTREGTNAFIDRDEMVKEIGLSPRIIVTRAVSDLRKGLAADWCEKAKEIIQSKNFVDFSVDCYFEKCSSYSIESFIKQVSKDLGVDEAKVEEQLWAYS